MKTQLRIGSDSKKYQATAFDRAYLLVQKIPNAGVSADTDLDLTKLRVSIEIKQADLFDSTSFDAVGPVVYGAMNSENSETISSINFGPTALTCEGNPTTSADLFVLEVPLLKGGYIFNGEDYVCFNIDIIDGFFGPNCDANSSVYLVIEPNSDISQIDVNIPVYYPITADKNSPSFNQSSVSEVWLLNSDPAYKYTSQPFSSIEFRSQYVNDRMDDVTLEQLRIKRSNQTARHGCNKIYNVEPSSMTDVEINLGIVTANVITGANFLFVSKVLTSKDMLSRAVAHNKKVLRRKAIRRMKR